MAKIEAKVFKVQDTEFLTLVLKNRPRKSSDRWVSHCYNLFDFDDDH